MKWIQLHLPTKTWLIYIIKEVIAFLYICIRFCRHVVNALRNKHLKILLKKAWYNYVLYRKCIKQYFSNCQKKVIITLGKPEKGHTNYKINVSKCYWQIMHKTPFCQITEKKGDHLWFGVFENIQISKILDPSGFY